MIGMRSLFINLIKYLIQLTFYDFPRSSTVTVEPATSNKYDGVAFGHHSSMEKPLLPEKKIDITDKARMIEVR